MLVGGGGVDLVGLALTGLDRARHGKFGRRFGFAVSRGGSKQGTSGADLGFGFHWLNFLCCDLFVRSFSRVKCREGGGTFTVLP